MKFENLNPHRISKGALVHIDGQFDHWMVERTFIQREAFARKASKMLALLRPVDGESMKRCWYDVRRLRRVI